MNNDRLEGPRGPNRSIQPSLLLRRGIGAKVNGPSGFRGNMDWGKARGRGASASSMESVRGGTVARIFHRKVEGSGAEG